MKEARSSFESILRGKILERVDEIQQAYGNAYIGTMFPRPIVAGQIDPNWQKKLEFKLKFMEGVEITEAVDILDKIQPILHSQKDMDVKLSNGSVKISYHDAASIKAVFDSVNDSSKIRLAALLGGTPETFKQAMNIVKDIVS